MRYIDTDIAIIGAGIAGAGVAANLAGDFKVVLVEQEDRPGYHSTGRSAAVAGFDRTAGNFFWLAGQGGSGIQTAPALSHLAGQSIRRAKPPGELEALVPALSPDRFRS